MSAVVEIDLTGTDQNQKSYGLVLESKTVHKVTGQNVHNRSFNHQVKVFENKDGKDARGNPSDEPYTFLLSAVPSVIAAAPLPGPERGETVETGKVVRLRIEGYNLGQFVVEGQMVSDPVLRKVGE